MTVKDDWAFGNFYGHADANAVATQVNTNTTALNARALASRTVNGHALTADVTVTKSDVGLGSVDNTADTAKPVSTAQAAADALVRTSTTGRAIAFAIALG